MMVLVKIDVFSGRQNPTWNLSPEECQHFISLFHTLSEFEHEHREVEGLGYRGIRVFELPIEVGDYDEVNVSGGVVFTRKGIELHYFVDNGREIEIWLLQTGQGIIDDSLYQGIVEQLKVIKWKKD